MDHSLIGRLSFPTLATSLSPDEARGESDAVRSYREHQDNRTADPERRATVVLNQGA